MDVSLLVFGVLMLAGLVGIGSRFIPGSKPDNKIEEVAEEVIYKETGKRIDLSPDTPDPDDVNNERTEQGDRDTRK